MAAERLYPGQNRDELARLRLLTDGLSGADLRRPLGSGWNAATTLAHLAFWDRAVVTSLRLFGTLSTDELATRLHDRAGWISDETMVPFLAAGISEAVAAVLSAEHMNDRLAGGWSRIPAQQGASDALEAAELLTDAITALDSEVVRAIEASRFAWMLTPSAHWQEHIAEIEAGLERAGGGQS